MFSSAFYCVKSGAILQQNIAYRVAWILYMFLAAISISAMFQGYVVNGKDLNAVMFRIICFKNYEKNCNESFIDVYKNISISASNDVDADTFFLLYTRKNPHEPEKLHKCAGMLPPNSNFNRRNRLILLILPYATGWCDTAAYREWKAQFLKREDANIIAIDYSWGNRLGYLTAKDNLKVVARQVVTLLRNIQKQTGISNSNIMIVGHSLGAQMAGFIGQEFHVGRIIGIDPAGPGFAGEPVDEKLDRSDADLVEVWHCNLGDCAPNLGTPEDAGHINFYINGGTVQKSCYKYAAISFLKGDYFHVLTSVLPSICSHVHCAQYLKVSINPGKCQFVGVKCENYADIDAKGCNNCGANGENCLIMGYDTDKYVKVIPDSPQRYYVKTSENCPYCDNTDIEFQGYRGTYESSLQ